LPSENGAELLAKEPPARDFVADAFAHMKFIGYTEPAALLFTPSGVPESRDEGFIVLRGRDDCSAFVAACRELRYWARGKR
jgi:catalase